QRGEGILVEPLFDDAKTPFGYERVEIVVMTQKLALLAVEAFDRFEFTVAANRIVRDARRLHEVAVLINEDTLVVFAPRSRLDSIQPTGRLLANRGICLCEYHVGRDRQHRGRTQQPRRP